MFRYLVLITALIHVCMSCSSGTSKQQESRSTQREMEKHKEIDTIKFKYEMDTVSEKLTLGALFKTVFNKFMQYKLNYCVYDFKDSIPAHRPLQYDSVQKNILPDRTNWINYYDDKNSLISMMYKNSNVEFVFDIVLESKLINVYLLGEKMGTKYGHLDGFLLLLKEKNEFIYVVVPPSPYVRGELPPSFIFYKLYDKTFKPRESIGIYDDPNRESLQPERYVRRIMRYKESNEENVNAISYDFSISSDFFISGSVSLIDFLNQFQKEDILNMSTKKEKKSVENEFPWLL